KPPIDSNKTQMGSVDYPIAYQPTYQVSKGPLQVQVVDPLNVVNGVYTVKFDSMVTVKENNPFYNTNKMQFGKWTLINNTTGISYRSDTTTIYQYEQCFLELGLALTITQVPNAGDTVFGAITASNGLLYASPLLYADSTRRWLTGVEDSDTPESQANWIRSGTYKGAVTAWYDWNMGSGGAAGKPWDPNKNFQKIQSGTWAPYCLSAVNTSELYAGPAANSRSKSLAHMDYLASVDIVMTPDKSLWTRCPVIELCPKTQLAEGGAKAFYLREAPSVNIDGDTGVIVGDSMHISRYISAKGMGWFPGYAINLETGERLNMMFGENSWLSADNGRDMLWNPSSRAYNASGIPVFGGQHYVYVMNHISMEQAGVKLNFPAYDGGAYIVSQLYKLPSTIYKDQCFATAMYVNIPLAVDGQEWLSNAVTTKIRISKPYQRYYSTPMPAGSSDTINRNYPMYMFSTSSISTSTVNTEKAKSDLDLINVVPNPYFAYDDYETGQLDNRIKIVNLPASFTLTIFDMSGTMIRQYKVGNTSSTLPTGSTVGTNTTAKSSLDWDLKNFAGIPIAGGVYLIHIKAEGLGERTIKWFGILRPVDLNSL
ncbi:MAG: hypothetical protein NTW16_15615, partial [Bacteroidetes bacterium]|nr:hypothetical protein [Bacteroidota bacterium]